MPQPSFMIGGRDTARSTQSRPAPKRYTTSKWTFSSDEEEEEEGEEAKEERADAVALTKPVHSSRLLSTKCGSARRPLMDIRQNGVDQRERSSNAKAGLTSKALERTASKASRPPSGISRDSKPLQRKPTLARKYSWGSASSASEEASTSSSSCLSPPRVSASRARDAVQRPRGQDARPRRHAAADAGQAVRRLARMEATPSPARASLKGFVDSRASLALASRKSPKNLFSDRVRSATRVVSQPPCGPRRSASKTSRKVSAPLPSRTQAPSSDLSSVGSESFAVTEGVEVDVQVRQSIKSLSRMGLSARRAVMPSSDLSSLPSSSPRATRTPPLPRPEPPLSDADGSPLEALLRLCDQAEALPFPSLLEQLSNQVRGGKHQCSTTHRSKATSSTSSGARWDKVGEASYSEVFGIGDVVIKVIPLLPDATTPREDHQREEEWPEESRAQDVFREVAIMQACGEGFIKLLSSHVVRGVYPTALMRAWDAYDRRKAGGSENARPACLPSSQEYAVLVLQHGGVDVESVKLKGWTQAAAVFWQIAHSLARAEEELQFEHRDLHWGNVLVSIHDDAAPVRSTSKTARQAMGGATLPSKALSLPSSPLKRAQYKAQMHQLSNARRTTRDHTGSPPEAGLVDRLLLPSTSGATARLIDLSLSRATLSSGTIYCAFEDETIFEGEGDEQFDIYRSMRSFIRRRHGADWREYCPETNLMWCAYMIHKLLKHKGLRRPGLNLGPNPFTANVNSSHVEAMRTLNAQEKETDEALTEAAHASLVRAENKIRSSLAALGAEMQLCACAPKVAAVAQTPQSGILRSAGDLMRWATG